MSTATRTADPTGAAAVLTDAATGAVAVDGRPSGRGRRGGPELPVVVIDLARAARRFRDLREAFPWVDVHYDVSALAHPALLGTISAEGAGFTITHEAALPALRRVDADLGRVLHAAPGARWLQRRSAWAAGVRLFVVDDPYDLDTFVSAPAGTAVLLRVDPDIAVPVARHASALGVQVAGLSLPVAAATGASDLVALLQRAVRASSDVAAATGRRLELLDLGDTFSDGTAIRPAEWPALARTVRSLVAPATSRTTVLATAGRALVSDCITVSAGGGEQYADGATASACIDAGCEVVVLREGMRDGLLSRLPLFRTAPAREGATMRRTPHARGGHRTLRPSRARSTWSPAG
ncbi:hypothetical protein [Leifsonia sp. 21MFCrub1.1]|uniref:hypothetical protein n=1 Tax=Leifsonia sp. 21MFCrub1.1 TaxID=1798223 RepID=UPI000892A0E0|nr:hypothetical protein [Leifsonia sp. 21MFCrub1.1]SEA58085.1 Pyridoxal-dependent decarboxylase, pyridoxal binding domain [Leifsonia sp. 21MFCrub1.1]